MKTVVFIFSVLFSTNVVIAQCDTIFFKLEKNKYEQLAKERLEFLYKQEKQQSSPLFAPVETNKVYVSPSIFLTSRYALNQLKTISIPILGWNQQSYKCGDNLEPLIAFKQDCLFQMVFIVTKENNLKVGAFEIFDSYNEENRKKDSLNNIQFPLHGRPVMSDSKKIEKEIHNYILENPNAFVFMIKGLHGYWAVIEGKLVKLVSKGCKIKGEPSSEYVCKQYGQEFINDVITDSFRTGYKYLGCPDCKKNKLVKIDIKN